MMNKEQILIALRTWVNQRPGLKFANYGDTTAYRSELRSITKDRRDALELLNAVALRGSITADDILSAFPRAFSGRLEISETTDGRVKLDYCAGQYWPTEYRKAACAVLSAVLWSYVRDGCMPKGQLMHNSETGETLERYDGLRAGDYIRRYLKREFGRSIASRWFN